MSEPHKGGVAKLNKYIKALNDKFGGIKIAKSIDKVKISNQDRATILNQKINSRNLPVKDFIFVERAPPSEKQKKQREEFKKVNLPGFETMGYTATKEKGQPINIQPLPPKSGMITIHRKDGTTYQRRGRVVKRKIEPKIELPPTSSVMKLNKDKQMKRKNKKYREQNRK
ncbi:MAG: hypothetical protein UR43_C0020G0013 [candidate division TM6 bacterium GW2011_GWF2_33_332]|nr:MAG: hypothetical protein UR43_C0020G0013 [candidate division TM6 bacterium GW2011_GWF2_33_332]